MIKNDARLAALEEGCIFFRHTSCISATIEVLSIKSPSDMDTILGGGLGNTGYFSSATGGAAWATCTWGLEGLSEGQSVFLHSNTT